MLSPSSGSLWACATAAFRAGRFMSLKRHSETHVDDAALTGHGWVRLLDKRDADATRTSAQKTSRPPPLWRPLALAAAAPRRQGSCRAAASLSQR